MKAQWKSKRVSKKKTYKKKKDGNFGTMPSFTTAEQKYLDTTQFTQPFNNTGPVLLLNGMPSGSGYAQRVGRKVAGVSLELRAGIYPTATNQAAYDAVRYAVVYDRSPNGSAAAYADVFENDATSTSSVFSLPNISNKERFKILLSKTITTNPTSGAVTLGQAQDPTLLAGVHHYIKLGKALTQFLGDAASISSMSVGSLLLFTFGAQAAGVHTYALVGTTRFTYEDF